MKHNIGSLLSILALIAWVGPVSAHDFWIEPSDFTPNPDDVVELTLRVGDHFIGTAFPRDPYHLSEFVVADPLGSRSIDGTLGGSPAGWFRARQEGLCIIGYRSAHTNLQMEASAFETYLNDVGLHQIVRTRVERGESAKPGREAYARFAKTLLQCGSKTGPGHDRLLGFDLEIVPQRNPYSLVQGEDLPVRVLFEGTPVNGIQVAAIHEHDLEAFVVSKTDASGLVDLSLDREGVWMITTVHMVQAPPTLDADWKSLWASLTFRRTFEPITR